jgi:uncharacterized protein YbcI
MDRRAAISNAITTAMSRFYGKGPERVRTYFHEDNVISILEGGLTASEETLLTAGGDDAIRDYRQKFQSVIAAELMRAVADITGRGVRTYHSQTLFRPMRTFELFILDGPVEPQED